MDQDHAGFALKPVQKLVLPGAPSVFVGPFRLPNPFDLERYRDYLALAEAL